MTYKKGSFSSVLLCAVIVFTLLAFSTPLALAIKNDTSTNSTKTMINYVYLQVSIKQSLADH